MSECDSHRRVLLAAAAGIEGSTDRLRVALHHGRTCAACSSGLQIGQLVSHESAEAGFGSYAEWLERGGPASDDVLLVQDHLEDCDACAVLFGELLARHQGVDIGADLDAIGRSFERVAVKFLSSKDQAVRQRAAKLLRGRAGALAPDTRAAIERAGPSPVDYEHIALLATSSLRHGPGSSFARLVRELSPYLMDHQPHLYLLEGSYRTLFNCGLLRTYPEERLHCLSAGRLGGLIDLGAGVFGDPVAGLESVLGNAVDVTVAQLDLDWTLDCVVYLIDPLEATSAMPETLALKSECVVMGKPFLDTYATAVEFFALLGSGGGRHSLEQQLPEDLREPLGYEAFPHHSLALTAHDFNKEAILDFARRNLDFLLRFGTRMATRITAALLNGEQPDRLDDDILKAAEELRVALVDAGIETPWVQPLETGREGGNLQIGEAVATGICDCVLLFSEPRPEYGVSTQLVERSARISNHPERLGMGLVMLHEPRTASIWAEMWRRAGSHGPATLVAAFRDLFDVELVLAGDSDERWSTVVREAAWYLLALIATKPSRVDRVRQPKRVTLSSGMTTCEIIHDIGGMDGVAAEFATRIRDQQQGYRDRVESCKARFSSAAGKRRIDLIAKRKQLSLTPFADDAMLYAIGPVEVGPMIGRFASPDGRVEAAASVNELGSRIGARTVGFDATAFTQEGSSAPSDLVRHWKSTDVSLMTCADLAPNWFSGGAQVELPRDLYETLRAKGAIGEIAGVFLDADGNRVEPEGFRRNGMPFEDMMAIKGSGDGCAAILVAGTEPDDPSARVGTVHATLRAGLVSVLVTEPRFATAVLRKVAERGAPGLAASRSSSDAARS